MEKNQTSSADTRESRIGQTTTLPKGDEGRFSFSRLMMRTMAKDIAALSKKTWPAAVSLPARITLPTKETEKEKRGLITESQITKPAVAPTKDKISSPPAGLPVDKELKTEPPKIKTVSELISQAQTETPKPPSVPSAVPYQQPKIMPQVPLPPTPPKSTTAQYKKFFSKNVFYLVGGLALLVATAVGGWFLLGYAWPAGPLPAPSPTQTPSLTPSATPVISVPPQSLFNMEWQEIIELKAGQTETPGEMLQRFSQSTQPAGSFTHILFKITNTESKFLDFEEIAAVLSLNLFNSGKKISYDLMGIFQSQIQTNGENEPSSNLLRCQSASEKKCLDDHNLSANIASLTEKLKIDKYSLFAYWQELPDSSPFRASQTQGQIGFVVELQDDSIYNIALLKQVLSDLEPYMISGFKQLFLNKQIQLPENLNFSDNVYQGIAIRYLNLPYSDLTIDYAIVKNRLVVTTSKTSVFAAIDRLMVQTDNSSNSDNGQSLINTLSLFSEALKNNDETAGKKLFLDEEKGLNIWQALSSEQRIFFGVAIEENLPSISPISEEENKAQLEIALMTENGNIVKAPISLSKDLGGNWKISTW